MQTAATPNEMAIGVEPVLAVALELSLSEWKIAFSTGLGQQPRYRVIPARNLERLGEEIERAKERFRQPRGTRVVSCYEAGRDGFWLHRALLKAGVESLVVDSSSIEMKRRSKRAKTDRLDAGKLVGMLLRWLYGDKKVWSVVRVPTEEEEDRRQLHRELNSAKRDRVRLTNRIKGLLFAQGIYLAKLQDLLQALPQLRTWSGKALPERLMQRLQREWEKVEQLGAQIRQLDAVRRRMLKKGQDTGTQCARKLFALRGIGMSAAWLFALEFYAWREFKNVRQIGSLAGLTPTPYQSGKDGREQGIDKSGNRWIRALAIEIAWGWLRYQPESELSRWYECRFARGGPRMRRVGIVALARKLLIELWKYLETGTPPAGAQFKAA